MIEQILTLNKTFLMDLQTEAAGWLSASSPATSAPEPSFSSVFLRFVRYFKMYSLYSSKYSEGAALLSRLRAKSDLLNSKLKRCSEAENSRGGRLETFSSCPCNGFRGTA